MSFTRRAGNYGKPNPLSSVGQRRPGGNTFGNVVGQNKPPQPQTPIPNQVQQQFQAQLQQQEKARAAQQQAIQNQPPKPQMQKPPQPTPAVIQKPPQLVSNMQQAAEQMIVDQKCSTSEPVVSTDSGDVATPGNEQSAASTENAENTSTTKSKPFWMKRNGRINRAERAKRRNVRLRKLLQPKNALMIINELVGHVSFDLSESKTGNYDDMYRATVVVDGKEHVGFGKSKALAKSSAAETAVRSMILNKLTITPQESSPSGAADDENKEEKMEVTEENLDDVSWTHIASFAIHKLFSSWGDDGNMADAMSRATSMTSLDNVSLKDSITTVHAQPEQKPAKKLPDNAALMNPIMLLNQMHPSAKYEELGKTGAPPHLVFTIRCTVGAQSFVGTGPNKKAARKQAAFEACKTLLGIQYPPDILQGTSPAKMETA